LTYPSFVRKVKKNLVFGKAVQVRHYPVTVNAESRNKAKDHWSRKLLGRSFRFDEA
jgi:hypothetical protein